MTVILKDIVKNQIIVSQQIEIDSLKQKSQYIWDVLEEIHSALCCLSGPFNVNKKQKDYIMKYIEESVRDVIEDEELDNLFGEKD